MRNESPAIDAGVSVSFKIENKMRQLKSSRLKFAAIRIGTVALM